MNGDRTSRTIASFIGAIVLAMGLLIALLSGGCTLVLAGVTLSESLSRHQSGIFGSTMQGLAITFGIGGVVFAVGAIVSMAGWRMIRDDRPKNRP